MTVRKILPGCAWAVLGLCLFASPALAQTAADYRQRQQDLVELASVFGELHHIRRLCEPRFEGDVWRERMKKLVELEQPQFEAREEMVKKFNAAYRSAGNRFLNCDRRARDYAAKRALFGESIIARLSVPLENALDTESQFTVEEQSRGGPANLTDLD